MEMSMNSFMFVSESVLWLKYRTGINVSWHLIFLENVVFKAIYVLVLNVIVLMLNMFIY